MQLPSVERVSIGPHCADAQDSNHNEDHFAFVHRPLVIGVSGKTAIPRATLAAPRI